MFNKKKRIKNLEIELKKSSQEMKTSKYKIEAYHKKCRKIETEIREIKLESPLDTVVRWIETRGMCQ